MTTTSKKSSPEEELDRQYRDYKAQFEAWKEKNKNSYGSDAYKKYVQQFETWEKDVQKRREQIRARAEQERQATAAEQQKRREAAEAREKQAAEAAAYEQQQKAYLAHHQKALQHQHNERQAAAAAAQTQQQLAHQHPHASSSSADGSHHQRHAAPNNTAAAPSPTIYHQTAPVNGAAAAPPAPAPQLWGNTKVAYDHTDPMFRKWGPKAAPSNSVPVYPSSRPDVPMTPCWLLIDQMKEQKLVFEPSSNLPPQPLLVKFTAPIPAGAAAPPLIEPPEKRPRVV